MSPAANDDRTPPGRPQPDLDSYVRGGLSRAGRAEVEGFLACNPDLAAGVMGALHRRRRERLTAKPARRWRSRLTVAVFLLSAGASIGLTASSLLPNELAITPEYLDDAVMSSRAALQRAVMHSQPETTHIDAREIAEATQVRLPGLPSGWRLLDVQVFPADAGLAVSLLVRDENGAPLNLFAVKARSRADATPDIAKHEGEDVAYWEIGDAAYALTGESSREELVRQAARLSRSQLL